MQDVNDRNYPHSSYSKKSFYTLYNRYMKNNMNVTYFRFSISLAGRATEISNEDNYSKLVQNILNSLSLFLNVSILECHLYVGKMFLVFTFLYHGLLKLKVRLETACSNLPF